MTTETKTALRQSIEELEVYQAYSGSHWDLYLDPEAEKVYLHLGNNSQPMAAFHKIDRFLFRLHGNEINESIVEAVLSVEADLESLIEMYQGTEWNGNNHIGQWDDDVNDLTNEISDKLHQYGIASYWDADEWFSCSNNEIKQLSLEGKTAEEIVDTLGCGDIYNGMVDRDEAVKWVKNFVEENLEDWQEED